MATIPPAPSFDLPGLLARERGGLMATLGRLGPGDWDRRTDCPGWRVRDLVSHLWSTDLGVLSRLRDGHTPGLPGEPFPDRRAFVAALDAHNQRWLEATRALSPRLLVEALRDSGAQVTTLYRMQELTAPGEVVRWAAPDPAPLWFSGARDLTERFVHQQQIRAAVGHPAFDDEDVLAAVVDSFAYAFPVGLREVSATPGTVVVVEIHGPIARRWTFARTRAGWSRQDPAATRSPDAALHTDADTFWRLLSGGLTATTQVQRVRLEGSPSLFAALRDTRAVLV
jgi:uncharacterized protein (TIGR03083 family)